MHRLLNQTMAYDWGAHDAIPRFMGLRPDGRPVAEVWMGTHPTGPSRIGGVVGEGVVGEGSAGGGVVGGGVVGEGAGGVLLSDVAGELPFLFKILAAERPLSLQVHPTRSLATQGFAEEQERGIALDDPARVYKDENHKPEMVMALTTFDSLVGFRPTAEIVRVLSAIDAPLAVSLGDELRAAPGFSGIVRLVERLLIDGVEPQEVHEVVACCRALVERGIDVKRAYQSAIEISVHHPDDVGVVISLMLNRLTLQPGEAAFLDSGVIHAHLHGMCLEVMASSDNVLRAGLTNKHIDPAGLIRCLRGGMSRAARVAPESFGFSTEVFGPDVDEFALAVTQSAYEPEGVLVPGQGHRIVLCTAGTVTLCVASGERAVLQRGDSVHVAPEDGQLLVRGLGEVAQASAPGGVRGASQMVDLVRRWSDRHPDDAPLATPGG